MTESDLFEPIKTHFKKLGYTVDGEVNSLDMLMHNGDEHIAVELKKDLNLKLLIQGAKRQKMFEKVYVAIWSPKNLITRAFRDKVYLLNRLGIGLIMVSKKSKRVNLYQDPIIHPPENYRKMNTKRTKNIKNEFSKRKLKTNTGGVKNQKIITSYKEDSLLVLDFLCSHGAMKASEIKKKTAIDRSYTILYKNHYKWFTKVDKGIYTVSANGEKAHKEHRELIINMKKEYL